MTYSIIDVELWRKQSSSFKKISEETSYTRNIPDLYNFSSSDNGLKSLILGEVTKSNIKVWPIDIYYIDEAYISDECLVYDKNGNIFSASTADQGDYLDKIIKEDYQEIPSISEPAIFIFKAGKSNYGHVLIEMLPKLELLSNINIEKCHLIIPSMPDKFRNNLISFIDLCYPNKFQYFFMTTQYLKVSNLIYPGPVTKHNSIKSDYVTQFSNKVLTLIGHISSNRKIYVSRRGTKKRVPTNEAEIESFFYNKGYEVIRPEEYSWLDQARLFYAAKSIVGVSGAALSNLIYSRSADVWFFDPSLYDFFFFDLASKGCNRFSWIFTQEIIHFKIEFLDKNYYIPEALYRIPTLTKLKYSRVFVLGDSRTGTSALSAFFQKVGYSSISLYESEANMLPHTDNNYKENASRIVNFVNNSEYNAFSDYPTRLYFQKLYNEYPDALFILSVRKDLKTWQKSMTNYFGILNIEIDIDCLSNAYVSLNDDIRIFFQNSKNFIELCIDDDQALNTDLLSKTIGYEGREALEKHNSTEQTKKYFMKE